MEQSRLKILLLTTNLGKGGAQRAFYDQAVSLSSKYEVIEAVFDDTEERLYDSGLPIHYLSDRREKALFGPIGRLIKRANRLRKLVRIEKIDLVISHMDGANWASGLSNSAARKIFVVHGTILHDKAQSGFAQWLRTSFIIPWFYKKADRVVAVSEGISRELRKSFSLRNTIHIPNMFDPGALQVKAGSPLPAAYNELFESYEILITAGRLVEQKGHEHLFEIYRRVKPGRPSVRLVILGDGPLRTSLIEKAKEAGLSVFSGRETQPFSMDHDVYFAGFTDNPYAYLKRSKLFLFPSVWEGFPLALCEAMICGVPVLSADCPTGPREILAPNSVDDNYTLEKAEFHECGVLLPLFDKNNAKQDWAEAVKLLLSDEAKHRSMASAAKNRISAFDKISIQLSWLNLIQSLTKPNRS